MNDNQAYSWLNSNGVVLDLAFARSISFMVLRGTLTADTNEDVIMHEMSHAMMGTADFTNDITRTNFDGTVSYNFPGPNQTIANRIAYEMGFKDFYRTGYYFT